MEIDLKAARRDLLTIVYKAKAPHIGSCLSALPIIAYIYDRMGEHDKFILSKGHAAAALYTVLFHKGILSRELYESYGQPGSPLTGCVSHKVPGVILSTGSLGHGLPVACGMALRSKGVVHCLISDGELDCGTTWESALFIKRNKLKNITVHIDCNGWKAFGKVEESLSEIDEMFFAIDKKGPFMSYGYCKGYGVSFMVNNNDWHYLNMTKEQYEQAMEENA